MRLKRHDSSQSPAIPNVCGYEYLHYTFPKGRWMVVRYLVCDTPCPVVSVAGLYRLGYSINFRYHKTSLL